MNTIRNAKGKFLKHFREKYLDKSYVVALGCAMIGTIFLVLFLIYPHPATDDFPYFWGTVFVGAVGAVGTLISALYPWYVWKKVVRQDDALHKNHCLNYLIHTLKTMNAKLGSGNKAQDQARAVVSAAREAVRVGVTVKELNQLLDDDGNGVWEALVAAGLVFKVEESFNEKEGVWKSTLLLEYAFRGSPRQEKATLWNVTI